MKGRKDQRSLKNAGENKMSKIKGGNKKKLRGRESLRKGREKRNTRKISENYN